MKKFLITILMMTALCVCGGCAKEPESTQTPPPPESSSVPKGDPEFPENEYGQDNEAVYPEVWD